MAFRLRTLCWISQHEVYRLMLCHCLQGLIRNQPNATLFDTNPIVPQSSTSLEALAFTPRPQVCDSTKQAFERLQERQVESTLDSLAHRCGASGQLGIPI